MAVGLLMTACAEPVPPLPEAPDPLPELEMPADVEASGRVVHAMRPLALEGAEETMTCYSWTVGNDAPLYVNAVGFQNGGSFHHSNWFVVPEDVYPGDDGFWPCMERDFNDVSAALAGTVLFAQSTQAQQETMAFTEGAVIRIPARSKIVAGVHLLNLGPDPRDTAGWMSLDVIHPGLVETILTPMTFSYFDLSIPPRAKARFTAGCGGSSLGGIVPRDGFELHYVLPHYHRTGVEATMKMYDAGVETVVLDHTGFGASSMGKTFDPPLSFEELSGIEFTCGYDNPHDETLTWGIGINEMCVFLAFVDALEIYVAGVEPDSSIVTPLDDGSFEVEGGCRAVSFPKGPAFDPPSRDEIGGPLVLPPSADGPIPEPPQCEDVAGTYDATASFSEVQSRVLQPWCSFSSCHGGTAGGLDLTDEAAYDALVDVPSTIGDLPRVAPGDPEGSALYRLLSECEPTLGGTAVRHMPAGAPTLLEPELVGLVRAWIEAGAPP